MSPEYLRELADLADPDGLWRLGYFGQQDLSPADRKRLDTGIALRRYAADVESLDRLRNSGKSLLVTPLGKSGRQIRSVDTSAAAKGAQQ